VVNGGALGTPSSGVATNLTGTASGLTAGHVTTNANLTGDVTSVGNASTIAANAVTNAKMATAADGTIKSNISGSTAVPSDNTITAVLDKLFGTTQGSVIYRGASTWGTLTPGTSGNFLKTLGAAANPVWSAVPGGGDMLSTNNLSDVASVSTSRTNLGLGTSAQRDLLGTVSQSGGTPTGSIIERGSNANGEYVKFADGTMICTKSGSVTSAITSTYGSLFVSSAGITIGSLPATFAATPVFSFSVDNGGGAGVRWVATSTAGTTTAWPTVFLADGISRASASMTLNSTAIGRWF
jgi:hypothetical protein